MCCCSFMSSSLRGGDIAFKQLPPRSSPSSSPLPLFSATAIAIAMKNMTMDDDHHDYNDYNSCKKECGSSCESPRSVLESSEGIGFRSNRNRVARLPIVVAAPSQSLPPSKKNSSDHEAAPPTAHKPTLKLTLQQHQQDGTFLSSSLSPSSSPSSSSSSFHSIFSVGSPVLASKFNDDNDAEDEEHPSPLTEEILTACFLCKRSFADGKDIYIYRGERAFCSEDCRYRQIVMEYKRGHLNGPPLLF